MTGYSLRVACKRSLVVGLVTLGGLTHAGTALCANPTLEVADAGETVEAARLLDTRNSDLSAERLLSGADGLRLLDATGATVASLDGHFGALDTRLDRQGLLVAALDENRQQAALIRFRDEEFSKPIYLERSDFKIDGLCLYRDPARNTFVFLIGEEGRGEQWLVDHADRDVTLRRVRQLSFPPASEHCQVDDANADLLINEENVGLWRYDASPEADLARQPVALRRPFGELEKSAAGLALIPGGMLMVDPAARQLHRFQRDGDGWQPLSPLPIESVQEPEQISAVMQEDGLRLLIVGDDRTHDAHLAWQAAPVSVPSSPVSIPVRVQTDPVPSLGDAADDPAIWLSAQPEQSRVLGTDKQGGLGVYDLSGRELQYLPVGRVNNVDVRAGFTLGDRQIDIAVASHRDDNGLQFFSIDPTNGHVEAAGNAATELNEIYGLCLFKNSDGAISAIVNDKDGRFVQYRLGAHGDRITAEATRRFAVATQPEGCVADDRRERLFIGEENRAVWTLEARADASSALQKVIDADEPIEADIEGLALYQGEARSYLVISSQGNDSYVVVDAEPPYALRGAFRLGLNAEAGIDGASETDGIEVTSANLGGAYSRGLMVAQDGRNRLPEQNQNYKYAAWADIAQALQLD
ncbi:phytase [Salinicola halophilus]|uniref:phytase n=1 Tax=Salinicola halophilus TaxID=184065 RepID=UPI000DA20FDA|nr:phytase [Salinicola halophilus]